mgnify:CR=1 FL=1
MLKKKQHKCYLYTRVSTAMQVDGYSLDAQKAKMKAYADYNDMMDITERLIRESAEKINEKPHTDGKNKEETLSWQTRTRTRSRRRSLTRTRR